MAESISIDPKLSKKLKHRSLMEQIKALLGDETDPLARLQNAMSAVVEGVEGVFWAGLYRAGMNELVLGPFQGPPACIRIGKGKGVCGTAWSTMAPQLVPDVDAFPGHIACSTLARSEIVVPIISNDQFLGVLDVDHRELNGLDAEDLEFLQELAHYLAPDLLELNRCLS